ncbi:VOC family protein [Cytobacillus sp. Hz8]|uniref:VOC family protein n=1 Tax=Cytobacillus sp. Hz8 TaxID=3347168 RepID=UPI0035DB043E
MNLCLDHIVHYVKEPELAQKSFSERGFTTVKGGRHLNWGTYNSLCYFSNGCYIEWIGLDHQEVAKKSDNLFIQQVYEDSRIGEGFSQLAFRTEDIQGLAARLKEKGFEVIGPVPGCRRREDGSLLEWSMLFIAQNRDECRLPFFIQWGEPEQERQKQFQLLTKHKAGNAIIDAIYFSVNDSNKCANQWLSLFDRTEIDSFVLEKWNVTGKRIHVGGIEVGFCEPKDDGFVWKEHIRRGERPFVMQISNQSMKGVHHLFGAAYQFQKNEKG